ncbi:MAG: dTMP kinase [Nitrospinae bacterium]|nr:dTMP kinase [Nitrospinota bacterium]
MPPQQRLARGVLVALEGIDGAGKSTQAMLLTEIFRAQRYDVLLLHEPSDSPWGERLRELKQAGRRLLSPSQELDLFIQDRRYDVATHIQPALTACKLVVMDRYYFSTMAYQGALGIDPEGIRRLNEAFAPMPDAVFVLTLSPAQALERIRRARGNPDDVFEQAAYLEKVDAIFRTLRGPHIHPTSADQPIKDVTSIMQRKVQEVLLSRHMLTPPRPSMGKGPGLG